jgi:hypothetical protein
MADFGDRRAATLLSTCMAAIQEFPFALRTLRPLELRGSKK